MGRTKGERLAVRVGARLRAFREMKRLTLREAAELASVERAQLCRIEGGNWGVTGPGIHTVARICDGLGLPMAALFEQKRVRA